MRSEAAPLLVALGVGMSAAAALGPLVGTLAAATLGLALAIIGAGLTAAS